MRWFSVLIFLLIAISAKPQSQLTGVQAKMVYNQETGQFQVTQKLHFDTIQAGQFIVCKALNLAAGFPSGDLKKVSHSGTGTMERIANVEAFQSFRVTFEEPQQAGWIEVYYVFDKSESLTEIPLFFSEFPAASSAEDFFTYELEFPEQQSVYIHFPTADNLKKSIGDGKQLLSFTIPALPSVIRLELSDEVSQASFRMTLIDLGVALVFIMIGLLIYRYRNELTYG